MKTYSLSYDFLGEQVSKQFETLFEFMQWLEKIEECKEICNRTIEFKTDDR